MTNLRQAAKAVVDRWDTPAWEWRDQGPTADLMADLRTALAQPEQEPSQWRDMVVVSLVREGINKHKARELADHFATPLAAAQRPWQGLTDEDRRKFAAAQYDWEDLLIAAEAKLKERNT
jgi:hypothetical protein